MGTACRFRPQRASVRCKDAAEGGDVPPPRSVRRNKACRLTAVTRSPSAAAQVFAAEFGWNHEIADPVPCHGTGSFPLLPVASAKDAALWIIPAGCRPAGERRRNDADRTNGRICVAAPSGADRQAIAVREEQTGRVDGSAVPLRRVPAGRRSPQVWRRPDERPDLRASFCGRRGTRWGGAALLRRIGTRQPGETPKSERPRPR